MKERSHALLGTQRAVQAWDISMGSSNVIVAVIDSGIRYSHVDLATQMWRNPGEIPGNGIDDDGDGYVDNVYGINAITGSSQEPGPLPSASPFTARCCC